MSIITGRGDDGKTDLLFGRRTDKTGRRVEALGAVDELNSALGLARASGLEEGLEELVDEVQEKLVGLMGQLACLPEDAATYDEKGYAKVVEADVGWLEQQAGIYEDRGVRFKGWARPGAEHSVARAGLDLARSVARRAERRVWELHEQEGPLPQPVLLFFNRLSDLLWILARVDAEKLKH
ncbi:cob(I)yrinic acid a,c-diamide adenosyltransferase [Haloferula sp. A504]|uniref:cob(I)yrinic acid a,c-diamide adenosyltransferase n=1 Tax=Haloferula sp. A504 TaxID=3373601 RepID=UPI0031C6EC6D|nr:cob(I)yrinic acid a,c-diamide adenosyltransferase [Verrucomicrobiaceae bacterium E54]